MSMLPANQALVRVDECCQLRGEQALVTGAQQEHGQSTLVKCPLHRRLQTGCQEEVDVFLIVGNSSFLTGAALLNSRPKTLTKAGEGRTICSCSIDGGTENFACVYMSCLMQRLL